MMQQHDHFVFQHVWKTGGTEICALAKLNGWHIPDGCNDYSVSVHTGWPKQDYKLIGNEREVPSNPIPRDYIPHTNDTGIEVHNVKWITILRHPYSRSLSHFYHMQQWNSGNDSFTMQAFFTAPRQPGIVFAWYIPDQQTGWHCGLPECNTTITLGPKHLHAAMSNLDHFDVVLILEDLQDPDSCSRQQMRSPALLNWTQFFPQHKIQRNESFVRGTRADGSNWDRQVRPNLDSLGRTKNPSAWGMAGPEVMAALGLYNALDLQLYGYAKRRCEDIAARLNGTEELLLTSNSSGQTQSSFQSQSPPVSMVYLQLASCVIALAFFAISLNRKGLR
jgi:hypothetical protein